MMGVIFTTFSDMVIERHGMDYWNRMLDRVQPPTGGAYTTAAEYADNELMSLVMDLSLQTDTDARTLIRVFGEYLFDHLMAYCPVNTDDNPTLLAFLESINTRVHDEVKRIHPSAYVPHFDVVSQGQQLLLNYQSERRLCALCEGLIQGAARHFGQSINLSHPQCMHDGHSHCQFIITLDNAHQPA